MGLDYACGRYREKVTGEAIDIGSARLMSSACGRDPKGFEPATEPRFVESTGELIPIAAEEANHA